MIRVRILCVLMMCIYLITPAFPGDNRNSSRKKVIDFEGDLVEGVNRRPLDSLSEISENQKKRKKLHLYRKRKGFSHESRKTLLEMRYVE